MAMTIETMFYKVYDHLLAQGERSTFNFDESCAYRGMRGLKCAVGCLITDEVYLNSDVESAGVCAPRVKNAVAESLGVERLSNLTIATLSALQQIHDRVDPIDWKPALDAVLRAADPYLTAPIDGEDYR